MWHHPEINLNFHNSHCHPTVPDCIAKNSFCPPIHWKSKSYIKFFWHESQNPVSKHRSLTRSWPYNSLINQMIHFIPLLGSNCRTFLGGSAPVRRHCIDTTQEKLKLVVEQVYFFLKLYLSKEALCQSADPNCFPLGLHSSSVREISRRPFGTFQRNSDYLKWELSFP